MARKKKRASEDGGGGYNWMDTYGDLVTLLLCFFVLLYSFSSIDAEKAKELIGAFSGTSSPAAIESLDISQAREDAIPTIDSMVDYKNRVQDTDSSTYEVSGNVDPTKGEEFDELYEKIKAYIKENNLEGALSVERTEDTIILRFGEVMLFNSGKADLLPTGVDYLKAVIEIVSQNESAIRMVTIEGNTDNVPIKNSEFSDNWDLSVARAVNTLRCVLSFNVIGPERLSAVGYGEYQPIDTNETEAGRAHNRRVDFVIQKAKDQTD